MMKPMERLMPRWFNDRKTALILKTALVLVCFCTLAWGQLANEGKRGLYVKSIAQVLRLPDDEIDIGTAALIVSEEWSDVVQGLSYRQRLNDMALEIQRRLKDQGLNTDFHAVDVINHYLYDELGFTTVPNADNPEDLFLHTVLDKRRGYCLSLSILYLSLAERLGLPIYGVVVPGHFFVRYDDGTVRFNIETTNKGRSLPDEYYAKKHGVPADQWDGLYLKNLSNHQTLGCFFNNFGLAYYQLGDVDSAIRALDLAVQINPMLCESRVSLGNLYVRKNMPQEAVRQLRAALEIKPDNAMAHCDLGTAYLQQDFPDMAIRQYRASLDLDPNLVVAHAKLAGVYSQQQHYGLAQQQLNLALALEPNNALLHAQLGEIQADSGQTQQAIDTFNKTLAMDYTLTEVWVRLGLCYKDLGNFSAEVSAYTQALTVDPHSFNAHANLAMAYFNHQQYESALPHLRQAIKGNDHQAILYYCLAVSYQKTNQPDEALTAFYQALQLDPKYGPGHYQLAVLLFNLKNYKEAYEHMVTAKNLGQEVTQQQLDTIRAHLKEATH